MNIPKMGRLTTQLIYLTITGMGTSPVKSGCTEQDPFKLDRSWDSSSNLENDNYGIPRDMTGDEVS